MTRALIIITMVFVFFLGITGPAPRAASFDDGQSEAAMALRAWLTSDFARFDSRPDRIDSLVRFYEKRQFQPAWMGPDGLLPQGAAMLKVLNLAWYGNQSELNAYVHHLELILMDGMQAMPLNKSFPIKALLQAEVGMSQIALYFASLLTQELQFYDLHPPESIRSHGMAIASAIAEALPDSIWKAILDASCPGQKPYLVLKNALNRYMTIQLLGGWPTITEGENLSVGTRDARVPVLRSRLVISGDMTLDKLSVDEKFDETLAEGVRNFQRRHGLCVDGVVGSKTIDELNVSIQSRIHQIKINMARWHQMPQQLGRRYLWVNIPGYRLEVVENNHVLNTMRAIVGKRDRSTPVLSAMLTYLEINPYWNIPQKIAREDILPKVQKDPHFLMRQHIHVYDSWKKDARRRDPLTIDWQRYSEGHFPFRLRQAPDAMNALGQIKFMFLNRYSVYIHDTPAKALFNETYRTFSSGCVRIENPMGLAAYLLEGHRWDLEKLSVKVNSHKREVVVLKTPIPVHLVYITAWVTEDGQVHFYRDVYGRDQQFLENLNSAVLLPKFTTDLIADTYIVESDKIDDTAKRFKRKSRDIAS